MVFTCSLLQRILEQPKLFACPEHLRITSQNVYLSFLLLGNFVMLRCLKKKKNRGPPPPQQQHFGGKRKDYRTDVETRGQYWNLNLEKVY